jgi:hypothetical protein
VSPAAAVARFHFGAVGRRFVPGLSPVLALVILAIPEEACSTLLIVAYGLYVGVPWGTFAEPSAAECCLPMAWAQLRRGRVALHLAFAIAALPAIAAFALRARGGSDIGMPIEAVAALALLIPLWPLLCTLMAPTVWRMGEMRVLLVAMVAAFAIAAIIGLCVLAANGHLVLVAGIGLAALAAAPFACSLGADGDQGAWRGTMIAPAARPEPPLLNRLRLLVAEPASILPPVPRALLLGLWIRPGYLLGTIGLCAWLGFVGGQLSGMPMMMVIAVATVARVDLLGAATVGGLLPRRLGLVALTAPAFLVLTIAFAIGVSTSRRIEIERTASPVAVHDPANIRRAEEAVEFVMAFPRCDEVMLADGSRLTREDWLTRRAERSAPTLDERQVAALLARVVERDDHVRVEPALLLVGNPSGGRQASTAPVRAEIDRAHLSWLLLQGLAVLVIGAALLAFAVGTRGSQRRNGTVALWLPFAAFAVIALIALATFLINPAIQVTLGDPIPLPQLSWWDEAAVWIVGHALTVSGTMAAVGIALLALAIRNAKWLPLVPDGRLRTV